MPTQQSEFAHWRHIYRHEFGLFSPDLSVNHDDDDYTVHRNVKPFVRQIMTRKNADPQFVAVYCLQDFAYEWFKSLAEPAQEYVTKDLNTLCNRLVQVFDPDEQARQKKEQEQRIKQQAEEARLTAFACRRCPAKFSSNTKLHQHIQDHHQKKLAKPASDTSITSSPSLITSSDIANPTPSETAISTHPRNELADSTPSEPAISLSNTSPPSKSFAERCASYINYPPTQYPPPSQLLSANFTCKQNPDMPGQVYCETCDLQFYGFGTHENPYQKHMDYSPTCRWVLAEREPKTPTPTSKAVLTPPATPPQLASKPPATPPPRSEPALVLTPPTSPAKSTPKSSLPTSPATPKQSPPRSPATPRNLSSAEITSRPTSSPLRLRLPIATPKNVPKVTEIETACPPTPPPTPIRNPAPKHQEQKSYLTIHDLFRMFDGKPKRTDLLHTNDRTKKSKSPPTLSNQAKITAYFKPAANQNRPITQDSKSSNPKSFHQRMAAEIARTKSLPPTKTMSEISANSPYKMTLVSRSTPSTESSKSSVKTTHFQASSISASSQVSNVCRTCSGSPRSSVGLQPAQNQSTSTNGLATSQGPIQSAVASMAQQTLGRVAERWDPVSLLLVCIIIRLLC